MASGETTAPLVISSRSFFDLPPAYFESCRLISDLREISTSQREEESQVEEKAGVRALEAAEFSRFALCWTCHTCKLEFDSLEDQRSHFKSDLHRLNVKLHISGRKIVKEEDFDEAGVDFDVSSISGSEDEQDNVTFSRTNAQGQEKDLLKQKLYIRLCSGSAVSLWRCLILDDSEDIPGDEELNRRLNFLARKPQERSRFRIVLLTCGGHFAGCVFDENSVVTHKTFHRYVVRAKSGQRQSAKDATGKAANSAGSSLRRYNEAALKKDIHDLLDSWKPYFDASSCIFIYAPSKNYSILPTGTPGPAVRHIPVTVRRPTFKEAQRVYRLLTQVVDERIEEKSEKAKSTTNVGKFEYPPPKETSLKQETRDSEELEKSPTSLETELHEAAKSGDVARTLELLERGANPCARDFRGRTPYVLTSEKEVRNTFRRFMALNPDKWDWRAAGVPSPLTREMEESQAAKQAEKDAKRKAKAKEMKKLRKEKERARAEKAAQASAAAAAAAAPSNPTPSKEMDPQTSLVIKREKMAAAAEARIAASKCAPAGAVCCYCGASLAGLVPFHRYYFSYCSSSCMHSHREPI